MKEEGLGRVAIETQIPFSSHVFNAEMYGLIQVHKKRHEDLVTL